MSTGSAFFNDQKTVNALAALAAAEHLTVVAGAGVSVESGLPTWSGLVHELLLRAGSRLVDRGVPQREDVIAAFARWTMAVDGLLAGAAVARAAGLDDTAVRDVLYSQSGPNPGPGPSARALAALTTGTRGVEIATQNYDDGLGVALEEQLACQDSTTSVHRLTSTAPTPQDAFSIRHLHGLLPAQAQAQGPIVLSEDDYFGMGDTGWQAKWMRERLDAGPCLFVGSSMSDPNLLRYLHQASQGGRPGKRKHVAVLPRQADAWLDREAPTQPVREARDAGALKRWSKLGVTVLQPEYYSDAAQLLFELLQQRRNDGLSSYAERLRQWEEDIESALLRTGHTAAFAEQQDWLRQELETYREQVRERLAEAASLGEERFQISLWVRQPGDSLLLLAASDRVHRDPATLEPVAINGPSEWISVLAYRQGSTLLADTSRNVTSRWNTVLGIPVSINQHPYGRLQVGVVALAGTAPLGDSGLSAAGPDALADIRNALEAQAAALLTPP